MDDPGLSGIAAFVIGTQAPQLDSVAWLQLAILVVTLILCGLASAAETALTSVSRIKLKNQVEEGDQRAIQIDRLLAEPNNFLSTILVVNSVAVIVASSMATALALRYTGSWAELISSFLVSLVVLIFCEITPKTAAVQNPMRWARALVGPVRIAAWFLHPLVWALTAITSVFVRMVGGQVKRGPFVTEEELRLLVTVGEEEGVLEEEETEMIHSIFEFADTTVREVMIPRIDMVTLASEATVNEAVDLALQGGFSRIPVYEESVGVDEVIGILYTKDMLKQLREGHDKVPVRDLVRPAYFVPETKKLDDLLREIRQNRIHMVMVVDEYGSVAGLVTIEDLVEEIVGDIKDEYDHEENLYEEINEDEYIFDAKMSISDFNDLMDTHLGDADYETLGGFVYAQLDKIPSAGDTVSYEDWTFTVLATRGRRITKIRVQRVKAADESDESSQSDVMLLPPPAERSREKQLPEHSSLREYRGA
ncbi:HlyC/CorC family transporter [Ktedonosporobacter rubrisoli]|uniref:HlyC/CorC family transporter n=1 Tax=Ktedonosporobacter rubrisoli TaxID=2509675 RepID=A0A4P6K2P8_KTERU|nr:hemolysin family protein [Ktedonosporobacter rubrisoli]QBD82497.1 HlyC/CorC family transporter [Ktedonosporobacter rubrisoli]